MGERLKGKVVLVTGGTRGIGKAIVEAVASEGAKVIINFRSSISEAEEMVRKLRDAGIDAISVRADVSKESEVERMFEIIRENYGILHGIVNNAGHGSGRIWNKRFTDLAWSDFEEVLSVDLKGTFLVSKFGVGLMRDGGSIVNVASISAKMGDIMGIPYLVAKAGVISLTKSMALWLAPKIRVNALVLGSIETGWINWLSDDEVKRIINYIPMGRLGRPEEVAKAVVFLLSDESSFITGHAIVIDGGECMACD